MENNKVTSRTESEEFVEEGAVTVMGARVHNLQNIDVEFPRNKLVVVTGLSGSGKSSLAFDTIYAEGQRRYIETFSAYARQFLGNMERPEVDKITGLSPVISIEQKTTNKNPRSTVGTITEIYDFLRLLFARASDAFSYNTGEKMVKYTTEKILSLIQENFKGKKVMILAPLVHNRKGHYKELFEQIRKKGYLHARVDGEVIELSHGYKLDRYKNHSIEMVVDRIKVSEKDTKRLSDSVDLAMKNGKGIMMILDTQTDEAKFYSQKLMCPTTGISYNEPAPHSFSFNSPQGACNKCKGLGVIDNVDIEKVIPDDLITIHAGGIAPLGKYKNTLIFWQMEAIAEKHGFTLKTPIRDIPEEALDTILHGSSEPITLKNTPLGTNSNYFISFEGVIKYILQQQANDTSKKAKKWAMQFVTNSKCPECNGQRLNKEALHFKLNDKNIADLSGLDLSQLTEWFEDVEMHMSQKQKAIAVEILKEIRSRLGFLLDVGLGYLSLNRSAMTLSGGESQRIRLATQIGSQLVNVLYILDEPSIGLHQRDNHKLIHSLQQLRDTGNTILVVEHDKDMMLQADYLIDMGPYAGRHGGEIVAQGTPLEVIQNNTLTADYLNNKRKIVIPEKRRKGNGKNLVLHKASGNNLKGITATFPLGTLICVSGVSGSGKSTLINETLYPILNQHVYNAVKDPLPYKKIDGLENIDKVVDVDQSPIGRTPRSNPATYTKIFDEIRKLFYRTT